MIPPMTIEPWLSVPDGQRAVAFYAEAFGASVLERLQNEDGDVDIAQFSVAGADFWISASRTSGRPGRGSC